MELMRLDFRAALESVGSVVGRSLASSRGSSKEEIREALQQRETECDERKKAEYFAQAAIALLEPELAKLEPDASERGFWTHIIEVLRLDPVAIYQTCKANDPVSAAAWVRAGERHDSRLRGYLKSFIAQGGSNVVRAS
jgi:hypothetical protein